MNLPLLFFIFIVLVKGIRCAMSDIQDTDREQEILDSAVAEGGAYEILRKRLTDQGQQLHQKAAQLNEMRLDEFGQSQMDIIGRIRIRTENNCQARDIVRVGEWLYLAITYSSA